jgi:hypothetical protein
MAAEHAAQKGVLEEYQDSFSSTLADWTYFFINWQPFLIAQDFCLIAQ